MTVHIQEMVSEVTVVDGDLPLTEAQVERIADFVIARLDRRNRDRNRAAAATELRPMSEPPAAGTGVR